MAYDAVVANEALTVLVAQLAVPNRDPVIPLVTVSEFKDASDPLTMSFFQLGILY